MSKLLKLKEWLTVEDAAKSLSISAGEAVTEADILRLALDGHLTLSVFFVNHARGRMGRLVPYEETRWILAPSLTVAPKTDISTTESGVLRKAPPALDKLFLDHPEAIASGCIPLMTSLCIDDENFLNLEDEISSLRGVWDLPMWGAEGLDVEHRFQCLTGGPAVTLTQLEGAFVNKGNEIFCQLQESFDDNEYQQGSRAHLEELKRHVAESDLSAEETEKLLSKHKEQRKEFLEKMDDRSEKDKYYPAGALPQDGVFVVRTSALRELEKSLDADNLAPDKQLDPRERATYERLLYVLAREAGYRLEKPSADEVLIQKYAATIGAIVPTGKGPIAQKLKAAAARFATDKEI